MSRPKEEFPFRMSPVLIFRTYRMCFDSASRVDSTRHPSLDKVYTSDRCPLPHTANKSISIFHCIRGRNVCD